MNKLIVTVGMGTSVFLLAGFLGAASTVRAADVSDSEQVSKLLSEAKTMAFQIEEDASTMESFTRMDVSMQAHKTALNQIKEHVNALERQVAKLKDAESAASPWQRTAINRIQPYLDELGGYTAAAIEYVNGEQQHTMAEYKDYLEANADYSADLAAMIGDFVNYGRTKQRLERLTTKLEVPTSQ